MHFRLPGHSVCDLQLIPIEKIKSKDTLVRKVREKYLINKFDSAYNGLNIKKMLIAKQNFLYILFFNLLPVTWQPFHISLKLTAASYTR